MTTKEWSHLPNAAHIDWVLDTLEKDSEMWGIARGAAGAAARADARAAARADARAAARGATWDAARAAVWDAVWAAARGATWDDAWRAGWSAVWDAVAALIAWGISGELLDKSVEEVTELAKAGDYDAVLMLSAVIVKNKLKDKNT